MIDPGAYYNTATFHEQSDIIGLPPSLEVVQGRFASIFD